MTGVTLHGCVSPDVPPGDVSNLLALPVWSRAGHNTGRVKWGEGIVSSLVPTRPVARLTRRQTDGLTAHAVLQWEGRLVVNAK